MTGNEDPPDREPRRPSSLVENPWFWLMLFGAVAAVATTIVERKFAARMSRVERMQGTRERVQAERAASAAAAASSEPPLHEPYVEDDFQGPTRLHWLQALTVLLMLAGTAGMMISRRGTGGSA